MIGCNVALSYLVTCPPIFNIIIPTLPHTLIYYNTPFGTWSAGVQNVECYVQMWHLVIPMRRELDNG